MSVKLWELIRDWLPEAGWEVLVVRPPIADGEPAFITNAAKTEEWPIRKEPLPPDLEGPWGKGCALIRDNEIVFWQNGVYKHPIKASDPQFLEKLDETLVTIFANAEWFKIKMGWIVPGRRERIWPK